MRFTLQVFLDVCSCRPSFSIVCSKLENLIYRQPAISNENVITWGIPDIDETDSTNTSTNKSSNTITTGNTSSGNSFNSANTAGTAKPNHNGLESSHQTNTNSSTNSSNTNDIISITEALNITNIQNKKSNSSESQTSNTNNETSNNNSNNNDNNDNKRHSKSFSSNSFNRYNKTSNDNNNSKNKGSIHSHSHSSHSSNHGHQFFNSEQSSFSNAISMSLNEPLEFILSQDNALIAQQLCLIEFEIFKRIKPRDLLQHIWGKRDKNSVASLSVAASIEHFNFISSWVTTQILEHKKAKHRAKVLGKFMKIAQHLRNYNNYNTLMAFIAGINCVSIQRLRQTKQVIENRTCVRQYKELETLMNSEKSFSAYRAALKQSDLPCVPYLGVFLRDLLYIDEANKGVKKDENGNDIININKYLLMGDIIMMIKNFQFRPYPFSININIINAINYSPILSDEDAYKRSIKLEPKIQK
ncbi:ras GEF [Neocallimastix sp. 'constans']